MTRYFLPLMMLMMTAPAFAAVPGGDASKGRQLHNANCTGCHDTDMYTRANRRISSSDALERQVNACNHQLKKNFDKLEVLDMVKYLNDNYYKFK
jgi:cytochrome c553